VDAVGLDRLAVEHGIGMVLGADAHILLAELLDVGLDGSGALQRTDS
jgi:hypothetical protein